MTSPQRAACLLVLGIGLAACSAPSAEGPGTSPVQSLAAEPSAIGTLPPTPEPTATPVVPVNGLLPNLVMEPLNDWQIEETGGRRLLHVTTIFSNVGSGAFELRGYRMGSSEPTMLMDQVIYTEGGGYQRIPAVITAKYAGDGHEHWHAQQVVTMELAPVLAPTSVTTGNKIHFCFFDNQPTNTGAAAAREDPFYQRAWCGTPDALSVRMGLSVGWGDRYGWDFVGQYIDITGLAGGEYTLRATVNASGSLYETDQTDNCTMSLISFPTVGAGKVVIVRSTDQPC